VTSEIHDHYDGNGGTLRRSALHRKKLGRITPKLYRTTPRFGAIGAFAGNIREVPRLKGSFLRTRRLHLQGQVRRAKPTMDQLRHHGRRRQTQLQDVAMYIAIRAIRTICTALKRPFRKGLNRPRPSLSTT